MIQAARAGHRVFERAPLFSVTTWPDDDSFTRMHGPMDNIEAAARDICSKQLSRVGVRGVELKHDIDRFWLYCAAALEAGEIDESGNRLIPWDFDTHMAAYRSWRQRHPDYEPPPTRGQFQVPQREPRCGALRLCDLDRAGSVTIVCEPCGQRGRYRVENLVPVYGPRASMPDVLRALAEQGECRRSVDPRQPCAAVIERERSPS